MLLKTRGIVLHRLRYSESSLIVKVYTEALGLRSYMLKGILGKTRGKSAGLYSGLSLLELVVYEQKRAGLQRIREARLAHHPQFIPFDPARQAIQLFLNEILLKCLREEAANPSLFTFLWDQLLCLDTESNPGASFHLYFLLLLSRHLGFGPDSRHQEGLVFSLKEGGFRPSDSQDDSLLNPQLSEALYQLMSRGASCPMGQQTRRQLLQALLDYYRHHQEGLGEFQSNAVLAALFQPTEKP
jgi:DNA repair protein RecO (recombination protein O)